MQVPNKFPKREASYRVAVIGEAPGKDEVRAGEPFVGMSGRFLKALMSRAGLDPDACFVGNICQYNPFNNDISSFAWEGVEIQSGLKVLGSDLKRYNPNVCILLGRTALKAAKPGEVKISIDDWRGSVFECISLDSPFLGRKCVATYHPAAVLRQYDWLPYLQFDLRKAANQGRSPVFTPPARNIEIGLSSFEIIARLQRVLDNKSTIKVGTDIEGYWNNLTCIALAEARDRAFVIPFWDPATGNYFQTPEEEAQVWFMLAKVLSDPQVKKVWQNGLYDRFCLQYGHNIPVLGNEDDIMLKHSELYCELEKSLAVQASLYTHEPFYKAERKSQDIRTYWTYNGKDSCVTKEIDEVTEPLLDDRSRSHYRFNHDLLNPILYMELRGMRYDTDRAVKRRREVLDRMYEKQFELDSIAGTGHKCSNSTEAMLAIRDTMCYKRDGVTVKAEFRDDYQRAVELGQRVGTVEAKNGELSTLLKRHLNVDSIPQLKQFLYGTLSLPIQFKKDAYGNEKASTDYESLLNLVRKTDDGSTGRKAVNAVIDLRALGTRAGMLGIHADPDGRIRCGYNIVGTETGRLTCYTSPTGSGYNLTTIPEDDRDLFLADEGYDFFQCDLAGADGWTVAGYLKMLGDSTMYDDYKFGLKPAKILALMLRHGSSITKLSRAELKERSKEVDSSDWDYFACKQGQHGTCYLMGPRKLCARVLIMSEGKVAISESQAKELQRLFSIRYRVQLWHDWMGRKLKERPQLIAASGLKRHFWGRPDEILGEALAHEPQANTTYATNLAAHRLWMDPENRYEGTHKLIIEPLHQVHDALCGQWPTHLRDWAKAKVREYFNNTLTIGGMPIIIPFEGSFGPSWSKKTHPKENYI